MGPVEQNKEFRSLEEFGSRQEPGDVDLMAGNPCQRAGIEALSLPDELVLYLPGRELVVSLNHSAAAVWELCDGQTTITEISRELGLVLGRPDSELLAEVTAAVRQLAELGLVEMV